MKLSNIGKLPIILPNSVSIYIDKTNKILYLKGRLGILSIPELSSFNFKIISNQFIVEPLNLQNLSSDIISLWGTYRMLIQKMVIGVSIGFQKGLELSGLGFKGSVFKAKSLSDSNILNLKLGYSHDINYEYPKNIEIKFLNPTFLQIKGIDSQKVSSIAYDIYLKRKPDPYKGKGVRSSDRIWIKKEGKKKK